MANYADYTYNSKNLLRRFSHRKRFRNSVASICPEKGIRILDFGCGDALFLNRLNDSFPEEMFLMGYEPFLDMIPDNSIKVVSDWKEVADCAGKEGFFDYVTCFEVLEHFSQEEQQILLDRIVSVLADNGALIVSVPIENGFPSLVKNLFRRWSSSSQKRKEIFSYRNIIDSVFKKEIHSYREQSGYLEHMGFYCSDLERLFDSHFEIIDKTYSPFRYLGSQLNSQVFYHLRLKAFIFNS